MYASAVAHPNIALIKYWGNRNNSLRLPLSGSLSFNLAGLETRTSVCFDTALEADQFWLNGELQQNAALARVSAFLDLVRQRVDMKLAARVESKNNFPAGAGIASSASAFAALALAASAAAGLELQEAELSALARRGSGSACRSIPCGFVEWLPGQDDRSSYAISIATPEHWDICDLIIVLEAGHKSTGSTEGHALAHSSPLNSLRLAGVEQRLSETRAAIFTRDFERLAPVVEADSEWMHAVMRTSEPSLRYWTKDTEVLLWIIKRWREEGHAVCSTVDAGPNVHLICLANEVDWLLAQLEHMPFIQKVYTSQPGPGAQLLDTD